MKGAETDKVHTILIVRLSAIGDIVMASGIIAPLRKKYPDSRIYWLAQPECKALLTHHPDLAGVIIWPRRQWLEWWENRQLGALWRALTELRRTLQQHRFDLVLDLQGLLKSGLMAWLSGGKRRIGLGSREGAQYLMHEVVPRDQGDSHLIGSEYRYLAQQLELPGESWQMTVACTDAEQQQAEQLLAKRVQEKPFAVICPFTTRPQKHWFTAHWVELILKLKQELGLAVVMLGGPDDSTMAETIAGRADITNLVGQTSLPVAAAIIARCRLLVGVDTGLTHMGHAAAVPTVALFGSTRPYLDAGSPSSMVIYHGLACAPCKRRPSCAGRFDCMRDIMPQEVLGAAQLLLGRKEAE